VRKNQNRTGNIVTAFDAREHDDVLYLVTELIEGEDLAKLVARKGRLRPRDAMFFIWQAAKGLSYAHQQGIIHRDIKPSNLILEKKRIVKVLDLGLARLRQVETGVTDDSTLTDSCRVLGTARYMAPEQARSAITADERADIYSLGCTLYFILMGQYLVAGWCDGHEMLLFVDGQRVATQPLEFSIPSTPPGLYIGGLPSKALIEGHGTRYFQGAISAVRIDMGNPEPAIASTAEQVNIPTARTLVCLPLHEGSGTTTADRSANHFVARIENARWLEPRDP
jgi:serine/threonine protein kinase